MTEFNSSKYGSFSVIFYMKILVIFMNSVSLCHLVLYFQNYYVDFKRCRNLSLKTYIYFLEIFEVVFHSSRRLSVLTMYISRFLFEIDNLKNIFLFFFLKKQFIFNKNVQWLNLPKWQQESENANELITPNHLNFIGCLSKLWRNNWYKKNFFTIFLLLSCIKWSNIFIFYFWNATKQ